jgi:hypothetical protein
MPSSQRQRDLRAIQRSKSRPQPQNHLFIIGGRMLSEQAMRMTNRRSALMTVFRGCFDYSQQGKCLERATAAFLILPGQLPSTWCQQNRASLGKTTDQCPLLTNQGKR